MYAYRVVWCSWGWNHCSAFIGLNLKIVAENIHAYCVVWVFIRLELPWCIYWVYFVLNCIVLDQIREGLTLEFERKQRAFEAQSSTYGLPFGSRIPFANFLWNARRSTLFARCHLPKNLVPSTKWKLRGKPVI